MQNSNARIHLHKVILTYSPLAKEMVGAFVGGAQCLCGRSLQRKPAVLSRGVKLVCLDSDI